MAKKKQETKPDVITLPPKVKRELRKMKDARPMGQRENDVVAGIALAMEISNQEYTYDDKKTAFIRIRK